MFTFPEIKARGQQTQVLPPAPSPLSSQIEVFVLTHGSKPSVTIPMLTAMGISFQVYRNEDWEWPENHPELQTDRTQRPSVRDYALRQFRAFRGHQEIMKRAATDKVTLVFEDDAALAPGVTPAEVIRQFNQAPEFLAAGQYEAVSFHGRNLSQPQNSIMLYGREYVELTPVEQTGWGHRFFLQPVTRQLCYSTNMFRWHEGCLAYMVGKAAREHWIAAGHGGGMPCDLFLVNELYTLVMRHSLFSHDQRHGSLIAGKGI